MIAKRGGKTNKKPKATEAKAAPKAEKNSNLKIKAVAIAGLAVGAGAIGFFYKNSSFFSNLSNRSLYKIDKIPSIDALSSPASYALLPDPYHFSAQEYQKRLRYYTMLEFDEKFLERGIQSMPGYYQAIFGNTRHAEKNLQDPSITLDKLLVRDDLWARMDLSLDKNKELVIKLTSLPFIQIKYLQNILKEAFSREGLMQILSDPSFKIIIAPPDYFSLVLSLSDSSKMAYGMYESDTNVVWLNEDFFNSFASPLVRKKLVFVLANELDTAAARRRKLRKTLDFLDKGFPLEDGMTRGNGALMLNHLCTNKNELEKVEEAFKAYENRILDYQKLHANKKNLNSEEQLRYKKYNKAIKSFVPVGCNEQRAKQIRRYQRNCFFERYSPESNQYSPSHDDHYGRSISENPLMALTEKLSDFTSAGPKIQRTFGSELCEVLSELHNFTAGAYCSRILNEDDELDVRLIV